MAGHDRITPDGKRFFKQIAELKKLQARAGFTAGKSGRNKDHKTVVAEDYKNKKGQTVATVADIAMWNELGTARSPPRPFLRQSVDNNTGQIKAMCAAQLNAIAKGTATAKDALQALGAMQVGLIQKTIRDGDFVENKPSTIRAKINRNQKLKKSLTAEEIKNNRKNDRTITRGKNKGKVIAGGTISKPLIDTGRMRQSVHYVIEEKGG